jgi:hypothetical protein
MSNYLEMIISGGLTLTLFSKPSYNRRVMLTFNVISYIEQVHKIENHLGGGPVIRAWD